MDPDELVSRLRHNHLYEVHAHHRADRVCVAERPGACCRPAGCDVFLIKPCLPNDLLSEVRQLLATTRSQTVDTPHIFQLPSHRAVRYAHGFTVFECTVSGS